MTNFELSVREREVAGLVAEGLTNKEISQRLYITTSTVKSHVEHAMRKSDARNRTQLAVIFARPFSWLRAPY